MRSVAVEFVGSAFLVMGIVGSGIMVVALSPGDPGFDLLVNAVATGCVLAAMISAFVSISGAHFNPIVTIVSAWLDRMPPRSVLAFCGAQVAGAFCGTVAAHVMFRHAPIVFSTHVRGSLATFVAEIIATFGLIVVIRTCAALNRRAIAPAVSLYIVSAYWLTSSTSFANPAVTIARAFTDTFAGIRPVDVPLFVFAELLGGAAGAAFARFVLPRRNLMSLESLTIKDLTRKAGGP